MGRRCPLTELGVWCIRSRRTLVAEAIHRDLQREPMTSLVVSDMKGHRPGETGHDDEPTIGLPTPAEQVEALGVGVLTSLE